MDDKTTKKIAKPEPEKASKLPKTPAEIWDWAKHNPGVIIGVASLFGVGGDQVRAALEADVPGWAAVLTGSLIPLLWYAIARAKEGLTEQRQTTTAVKDLQASNTAILARMDSGTERFDQHGHLIETNSKRIGVIEDAFRAEIAAYVEKTKRETSKLTPEPEGPKP